MSATDMEDDMTNCDEHRDVLAELLSLLNLEKIEENIFRGQNQDLGWGSTFGGQFLGQALSAAYQTVDSERSVHSLHSYFLRTGDPTLPIVYKVDPTRDGRSFSTRNVVAIQKGRAVFSMSASFHIKETGYSHQAEMPDVPGPEGIESELELAKKVKDKIPAALRSKLLCDRPIVIRPVDPMNPFAPEKLEPVRYTWFKSLNPLPDDPAIHQYLLAYASDFGFVITALYPHGRTFWDPNMQITSLDHAMWFHEDFRMDDWLLYAMHSPRASDARGLNYGRIFNRDGKLVASTAQEGLIRPLDMKK